MTGFNSKAIAYIDPIYCDENTVFTSSQFWVFRNSSWIISYVAKTMKTLKKYILYKVCNISKGMAPIGKRRDRFGEKLCMNHYQKEKNVIGSTVSELNPEL